jgi:hypothetical protein
VTSAAAAARARAARPIRRRGGVEVGAEDDTRNLQDEYQFRATRVRACAVPADGRVG